MLKIPGPSHLVLRVFPNQRLLVISSCSFLCLVHWRPVDDGGICAGTLLRVGRPLFNLMSPVAFAALGRRGRLLLFLALLTILLGYGIQ
jgi:hypothetical protein